MMLFNAEEMSVIRSIEEPERNQLMLLLTMKPVPSEKEPEEDLSDELREVFSAVFKKLKHMTDEEYAAAYAAAMEEDYAYGE